MSSSLLPQLDTTRHSLSRFRCAELYLVRDITKLLLHTSRVAWISALVAFQLFQLVESGLEVEQPQSHSKDHLRLYDGQLLANAVPVALGECNPCFFAVVVGATIG